MIGSLLTRVLIMIFGYAYPAYECYKAVERNKPEMQQLQFWCQYWIIVAAMSIFERVGDTCVSWIPLYSEAKLAFIIYLWFPKTRGTTYVYNAFLRPYVAKHENEIDQTLIELKTNAKDMAVIYSRKAVEYGQTRITEIVQFVASQSIPKPQPKVKKQAVPEEEKDKEPNLKATSQAVPSSKVSLQELLTKEPILSPKTLSSPHKEQRLQKETNEAEENESQTKLSTLSPPATGPSSPSRATKPNADPTLPVGTEKASEIVAELPKPDSVIEQASSSKETMKEETQRVSRMRLRKTRLSR